MALTPEVRRLVQQALQIRDSRVPLHRVMDILAMEDGDVSQAVNRFRDIKEPALRRAFHSLALLLRELEREAGLQPAWEKTAPAAAGSTGAGTGKSAAPERPRAEREPSGADRRTKPRFRPEDLQDFEEDAMRGQIRMAKVYVDGASKGNPGDAGIGVALFTMEGRKIAQISRAIGTATNNIAEYTALTEALKLADRMGVKVLHVISDSELMVNQMNGTYKIKNPEILKKVQEAMALKKPFEKFSISYVGRENNTLADALSTFHLKRKKEAEGPEPAEGSTDLMGKVDETADEGSTE